MTVTRPTNLVKPFCDAGTKNAIPVDDQTGTIPNGASYETGFPDITMLAKDAGGLPPFGQDMNGILAEITAHTHFQNSGGRYRFDAALVAVIGGYPAGFVLQSDDGTMEYRSAIDGNTGNFNTTPSLIGVTWIPYGLLLPKIITGVPAQGLIYGGDFFKSADVSLVLSPCSCLDYTGTVQLYYNTNYTLTISTPAANTIYHIYMVKLAADGSFQWRAYPNLTAILSDTEVSAYRRRAFCRTNSASKIVEMVLTKDLVSFGKASENVITASLTTSFSIIFSTINSTGIPRVSAISLTIGHGELSSSSHCKASSS